ncbi:MAG: hypothetical protein ACI9MR_000079 [Myxococcota bacterium]|jgi:hypothetical protein
MRNLTFGRHLCLAASLLLLGSAGCADDDEAASALIGDWTMTSITRDGVTTALPPADDKLTLEATLTAWDNGGAHGDAALAGSFKYDLERLTDTGGIEDRESESYRVGVESTGGNAFNLSGRGDDGTFAVTCAIESSVLSCDGTLTDNFSNSSPFAFSGKQ